MTEQREPTLDEMTEALILFGESMAQAVYAFADRVVEVFADVEIQPIKFPIKADS